MYLFRLLCFGVIIHFILLISIFDIYFKSPLVRDIEPEPNFLIPLGKRVVLISADGLRADSLFDTHPNTDKPVAEYVQSIIRTRGSWGFSQSHVPTESRPGHVAMLAGFYEDPSAVTKGWKENPVNFDNIFNRSTCSFAWGSPDILHIFFKGLRHNCAFHESYKSEQNFAGDPREYDNWVFEKFKEFLLSPENRYLLQEVGIFFFLHFLGQDTSGHTDKPHTEKYRLTLQNVDKLVEKIETEFDNYYGDGKTTFIFTSDHGMTDWGSHGAGGLEEISTPFVAWGSGIKRAADPPKPMNIEQADITPLLAILLGVSIPVNSVGVLPISYLNMSRRQIAEAIFLNAKQILAQYLKLLEEIQDNIISFLHFPFRKLLPQDVSFKVSSVQDAIHMEKYSKAIFTSKELIEFGLEGLNYYNNYFQRPLLYFISMSYVGWIFYLLFELCYITEEENKTLRRRKRENSALNLGFSIAIIITIFLIAVQKLPSLFYAYALLPEILWYLTMRKGLSLNVNVYRVNRRRILRFLGSIITALEVLVLSFFYRWCLCFALAFLTVWSLMSINVREHRFLFGLWAVSGCALGLFSFLPVVGGQPNAFLTAFSGVFLGMLSLAVLFLVKQDIYLFSIRFLGLIIAAWNNYAVHSHFKENQELLNFNKYISWFLLIFSVALLTFHKSSSIYEKLYQVFMTLSIPFLLLSIKHEGFFLFFLFLHLFCWIYIEVLGFEHNSITAYFRIAYFYLAYIFLSFFGLGNVSSLNSFDPAWVRCFLTVFSPFIMSILILLKTAIPFLVVTCTLRVLITVLKIKPEKFFLIVLIYSNVMALNFLYLVRNHGSWLDIGTSISHYVIQQITIVLLVLFFAAAQYLTKHSPYPRERGISYISNITVSKSSIGRDIPLPTFYRPKQHIS